MAKKKVKLSLFADDMRLYIQNPKDSTPRLLELIQQFGSVAGYKINAQKSLALVYPNNETEEREIKESIPFTMALKSIRYLGINLSKEVKDLYPENYRTLLKEIEEDTKRWKNSPCSWIGRINAYSSETISKNRNGRKTSKHIPRGQHYLDPQNRQRPH